MSDPQLNKRDFLKTAALLGAAAATPSAISAQVPAAETQELLDPKFASAAAHGFMSEAIHAGEEKGFSVTPIY